MRRYGPVLASVFVLVVGAITLVNVARNRAGEPTSDVVLTERELALPGWLPEENTGLALHIAWSGASRVAPDETTWFDRAKLESLGFDCRYPVEAPSAPEHYRRVLPREVALVLEYDGEAAKRWIAAKERELETTLREVAALTDAVVREKRVAAAQDVVDRAKTSATRLFVVDAGLDRAELRRRYPEPSRYVLAKGIVSAVAEPASSDKPAKPARLRGVVNALLVEAIQVPRGQRSLLDPLVASDRKERETARSASTHGDAVELSPPGKFHGPRYRVRVRWGRRLEPWIVSVEPT